MVNLVRANHVDLRTDECMYGWKRNALPQTQRNPSHKQHPKPSERSRWCEKRAGRPHKHAQTKHVLPTQAIGSLTP